MWPGAISYMPQDVMISNGTVRENVMLGFDPDKEYESQVKYSLEVAQLAGFVENLPEKLDQQMGDRGTSISGGQRQRLGIARAVFTSPSLLVLDEATSALDGETEANISSAIQKLGENVTVVMIAHRLSTVRMADRIIYMNKGKVHADGTFDEVRVAIPDFDRQANLMGL
jgi:ABC-type bacteriocin/lantibiotic exporter with double-glycine peptidase domain